MFLDCLTLENGTDSLSHNVGNQLPPYDAHPEATKAS